MTRQLFYRRMGIVFMALVGYTLSASASEPVPVSPFKATPVAKRGTMLVVVEQQRIDPEAPWQTQNPTRLSFTAALIEPGWLVVPAPLVSHATLMVAKEEDGTMGHILRVVQKDPEVGLAFLEPLQPAVFRGRPYLSLETAIPWDRSATLLYGTEENAAARTEISFSHLAIQPPPGSYFPLVAYAMGTKNQAVLPRSGIVVRQGKLVGLAFASAQGRWFVVPGSVIRHMQEEVKTGAKYQGFGTMNVKTAAISTRGLRAWLQPNNPQEGVRITSVFTTSPFYGKLFPNDVLVAVNGYAVDQEGFCWIDKQQRVPYAWITQQQSPGAPLSVTVSRGNNLLYLQERLKPHLSEQYVIPPEASDYLVVGGVLLQELSLEYVQSFGEPWNNKVPDELLYWYSVKNEPSGYPSQKVVVIRKILTDAINQSFGFPSHAIVSKVNDWPVHSIRDIRHILAREPLLRQGKKFVTIEAGTHKIIFSYEDLALANPRILQTYHLPASLSVFLPL